METNNKNKIEKYDDNSDNENKNKNKKESKNKKKKKTSLYTRRIMDIQELKSLLNENSSHGLCGSMNLGNTCFMNSAIACLSNCYELTLYFISGKFKEDINRDNKLGMGGALAEEWGSLLYQYWVEHTRVGDPSELKKIFGNKIKRFSGYSQQDSNEFIDLFLDNLNEDLNRVTEKKYIELQPKGEKETDEDCSRRFWKNYLDRNDSIITDLFCGQIKCTLSCPECNLINVTFDPFISLNLNLPQTKRYNSHNIYYNKFTCFYVPKYCICTPYKLVFHYDDKDSSFNDLFRSLRPEYDFRFRKNLNNLLIAYVDNNKIKCRIKEEEKLNELDSDDYIFVYDLSEESDYLLNIYFIDNSEPKERLSIYPRTFTLSKNSNFDELMKKIYLSIRKLILIPFYDEKRETDELAEKIKDTLENNETDYNELIDNIQGEYNQLFHNEKTQNHRYFQSFINNIPFKIYLVNDIHNPSDKIYILDNKNFINISQDFSSKTGINNFSDQLSESFLELIKTFHIVIEFDTDSKYINKNLFKLNNCKKFSFNYKERIKNEEEEDGKLTLKKCFDIFQKEEKLKEGDEWYCPHCKKHVLANKKMELYYLPKLLILCFKRFTKSSYFWEKNEEEIDFPINNLDMKDYVVGPDKEQSVYDLFAVSQHSGSSSFGHYTALCKNFNNWYSYNDSSVSISKPEYAVSSQAYVLFYRRKTD